MLLFTSAQDLRKLENFDCYPKISKEQMLTFVQKEM